jgi:hypothetical protein
VRVTPQETTDIPSTIAELSRSNRHERSAAIEEQLVRMRAEAYAATPVPTPPQPWPPTTPDLFPDAALPEVTRSELTLDVLSSALEHHGGVIVRGLFPDHRVHQLVDDIDATMAAVRRVMDGGSPDDEAPWFVPFQVEGNDLGGGGRFWAAAGGTVWAAESPRSFFDLLATFDEIGFRELFRAYFREEPVLSVVKTSLRRLPPDAPGGWHQDAYVYGLDTRTVNAWVALSPCGTHTAPGLDLVPRKFHDLAEDLPPPPPLVPVSQETIDRLAVDTPVVRPDFMPGDGVLFDSLMLHQTGTGPGFETVRYGIESWFFAGSTCPPEWVPLYY